MDHKEVYEIFKRKLSYYKNRVITWFPNGRNSVRVRFDDRSEYVFTYLDDTHWRFETRDSFVENMKGGSKM